MNFRFRCLSAASQTEDQKISKWSSEYLELVKFIVVSDCKNRSRHFPLESEKSLKVLQKIKIRRYLKVTHDMKFSSGVMEDFTKRLRQLYRRIWCFLHRTRVPEDNPIPGQKLTSNNEARCTAISDFESSAEDLLSFKQNDKFEVRRKVTDDKWHVHNITTNEEGYVLARYMQDDDPLTFYDWYRPKIDRNAAESMLVRFGVPGTFLIREKQGEPDSNEYTLSLRDKDAIKHYHIRPQPKGYAISTKMIFADLPALVNHYQHTSGGLCRKLKMPCPNENLRDGWEIKRNQIEVKSVLGNGHFAEVREGVWNETIKVALKQFKVDEYEQEKFMNEVKIMQNLKNSRLVQLYGVCMEEEPRLIVMELVPKGNLKKFLPKRSDLTIDDLLKMAEQVLEGLWYLEQNRVIHRDIAARNILVNTKDDLKISDFGLSRYLADKDFITDKETDHQFPIKWTAPESLLFKQFSIKSDVWSFGILLFEIITKGKEPYDEMTPQQTYDIVASDGYRMPCPPECETNVYKLMELCWLQDPTERPGFEQLLWDLREINFPDKQIGIEIKMEDTKL